LFESDKARRFQKEIGPHFRGAFSLARWLAGNTADAEDVLQEASIKAFRFLDDLESEDSRAWFYGIVRNTTYSLLRKRKIHLSIDDQIELVDASSGAEDRLVEKAGADDVKAALERLPVEFREILILREWEELSYREIAQVAGIPEGTVMSRISRARTMLKQELLRQERSSDARRSK
jgi:RNA polymerase sigma-70 factor (ECF subfamily)